MRKKWSARIFLSGWGHLPDVSAVTRHRTTCCLPAACPSAGDGFSVGRTQDMGFHLRQAGLRKASVYTNKQLEAGFIHYFTLINTSTGSVPQILHASAKWGVSGIGFSLSSCCEKTLIRDISSAHIPNLPDFQTHKYPM